MSLVTSHALLLDAQAHHYAVGAFNIENMEMAQAVFAAAETARMPVIVQTTPSTLKYAPPAVFAGMVRALAEASAVPAALHLDHGNSFALCVQTLRAGYTSVMIDGSALPFDENIALALRVTEAAHAAGMPVEAELGRVGGKEDNVDGGDGAYTDPDTAAVFVERTRVDALAVAIGTAHGVYTGTPTLDIDRLTAIRARVAVPLVLHGASGLSDNVIQHCIREGICKVNFATELRIAFSDGVKACLNEKPDVFDPKTYGKAGFERVREWVVNRIGVCGGR